MMVAERVSKRLKMNRKVFIATLNTNRMSLLRKIIFGTILLGLVLWGAIELVNQELRTANDMPLQIPKKDAVIQNLKDGEIFSLFIPEQIRQDSSTRMVIGIRNTQINPLKDRVCFRGEVRCLRPSDSTTYCDSQNQKNDVVVGGYDSETGLPVQSWFGILGEFDLKNEGYDVYEPLITTRSLRPQPYLMQVTIYREPNNNACADQAFGQNYRATAAYANRTFVLNIV